MWDEKRAIWFPGVWSSAFEQLCSSYTRTARIGDLYGPSLFERPDLCKEANVTRTSIVSGLCQKKREKTAGQFFLQQGYVMSTHAWAGSRSKFMQSNACHAVRKPFIWNKQRTTSPDEPRSTYLSIQCVSNFRRNFAPRWSGGRSRCVE